MIRFPGAFLGHVFTIGIARVTSFNQINNFRGRNSHMLQLGVEQKTPPCCRKSLNVIHVDMGDVPQDLM